MQRVGVGSVAAGVFVVVGWKRRKDKKEDRKAEAVV